MRAVAKKLMIPMIGCASHRLSLAVKYWLVQAGNEQLLEKNQLTHEKAFQPQTSRETFENFIETCN